MKKILALLFTLSIMAATVCLAATSNPSPASTGFTPMVIPIQGTYSSTTADAGIVKFKAPSGYKIVTVNANAKAVTGTNPTMKFRVKSGAFTNYSGTLTAAGSPADLTAGSTVKIADESTVVIDMVSGGTSPKWRDLTLFILLKRL